MELGRVGLTGGASPMCVSPFASLGAGADEVLLLGLGGGGGGAAALSMGGGGEAGGGGMLVPSVREKLTGLSLGSSKVERALEVVGMSVWCCLSRRMYVRMRMRIGEGNGDAMCKPRAQ